MGYLKNKVGHTPPNCSVSTRNLAAPSPKYALVSPSSPPGESVLCMCLNGSCGEMWSVQLAFEGRDACLGEERLAVWMFHTCWMARCDVLQMIIRLHVPLS